VESNRDLFNTDTKLKRVAWLSAHEPKKKFDQLMHHFNEDSLAACFHELDGKKAVGTDGIDKARYGENIAVVNESLTTKVLLLKPLY
jgi:hypothetical protein